MANGKRLTDAERGEVAEKIMDWGNLVVVGLAIIQVFSGVPLTLPVEKVTGLVFTNDF